MTSRNCVINALVKIIQITCTSAVPEYVAVDRFATFEFESAKNSRLSVPY